MPSIPGYVVRVWVGTYYVWQWRPGIATNDDDDRDDDWSEDFERYMTETGWLMEEER